MQVIHTITIDSEKLQGYINSVEKGNGAFVAGVLIGQLLSNFKYVVDKEKEE